jgi:hypothetical protein
MPNFLISYSTEAYYQRHSEMNLSAEKYGIDNIISFYDYDLKSRSFYKKNKKILDIPKGAGLWLWKPFFILEGLSKIQDGDCLLYVDSGSLFIADPSELFKICNTNKSGILAFDASPLNNSQWTKRDTFINLNADEKRYWECKHIIGTVIGFRKNNFTVEFVKEWLKNCQDYNTISESENIHGQENLPDFIDHRMDQSILSILIERYKIETYRNPSKWGNYLKVEQFREKEEFVGYPYLVKNTIQEYASNTYVNSPYGTIFIFNRQLENKPVTKGKISFYEKIFKGFHSSKKK